VKLNDKLQHVRNAAGSAIKLHWLDVGDRVQFRVCVHGVQVSAQHGAWIPVITLPTRV